MSTKVIRLNSMRADNFKGLGNIELEFGNVTTIYGANGTGKSTVFTMFLWCLFGKDQFGRADHQIKTLIDGKTDRHKPAEVEIVLTVNDEKVRLKRTYSENWVRPKAKEEDEFKGNETKRYINDVEVKASEYDAYVAGICPESIFKSVTNPAYFPNLKPDEQRAILFQIAGNITNESIAFGNEEFEEFLTVLSGKSFDVFRKEIASSKRRVKEELEGIPARIDELKRNKPEAKDFDKIELSIAEMKKTLAIIDIQIGDASKVSEVENNRKLEIQSKINDLETSNHKLKYELERAKLDRVEAEKDNLRKLTLSKGNANVDYTNKKARLDYLISERTRAEEKLKSLGEAWVKINSEQLEFKDGEFDCPTCKRPLDVEDIETKQASMIEHFNLHKSEKIRKNVDEGKAVKIGLESLIAEINSIGELDPADTSEIDAMIEAKKAEIAKIEAEPNDFTSDARYVENTGKIAELKSMLGSISTSTTDTSGLHEKQKSIRAEIEELTSQLGLKDTIEKTDKRIADLERIFKTLNQELSTIEKQEFTLRSFEYAKNEAYEILINDMFKVVRFNLFRTQVDGQVVPTCEAHVDGVPYSTQNNAMQINMGLDIINTISKHYGYIAPVFLDNREGVTSIPEMDAQVVNLVVDKTMPVLTIISME